MICEICGARTRINWGNAYTVRCERCMHAEAPSNKKSGTEQQTNNRKETRSEDYSNTRSKEKPSKDNSADTRIFSCPSCGQKIRVRLPLPGNLGKCSKCFNKFRVSSDDAGNIYIYGADDNNREYSDNLTIDKCFLILGIQSSATPQEIKLAYRVKMKEQN